MKYKKMPMGNKIMPMATRKNLIKRKMTVTQSAATYREVYNKFEPNDRDNSTGRKNLSDNRLSIPCVNAELASISNE